MTAGQTTTPEVSVVYMSLQNVLTVSMQRKCSYLYQERRDTGSPQRSQVPPCSQPSSSVHSTSKITTKLLSALYLCKCLYMNNINETEKKGHSHGHLGHV